MNEKDAHVLIKYLLDKTLPTKFQSSKSNFIATAAKYKLNKKNVLTRNNLPVVTESMQQEIYDCLHLHSGRTATWNRIKTR